MSAYRPHTACTALVLLVSGAVMLLSAAAWGSDAAALVDEELRHARMHYWFGVIEQGNLAAFDSALDHLRAARALLADVHREKAGHLSRQTSALAQDTAHQKEIASSTFFGIFPLVRFLSGYLLISPAEETTCEIMDDPSLVATLRSGQRLVHAITAHWKTIPQFDVFFNGRPPNRKLVSKLLSVFNEDAKFYVHGEAELAGCLSPDELRSFQNFNDNALLGGVIEKICGSFQIPRFIVCTIREMDVHGGSYFYQTEARLYASGKVQPEQVLSVMGLIRDRRKAFQNGMVVRVFLLCAALAVCLLIGVSTARSFFQNMINLIWVLLFYAGAHVIAWIVLPGLQAIMPLPEMPAVLSWWWPAAAGIALFGLPLAAGTIAIFKFDVLDANSFSQCLVMFLACSLGSTSYVALPVVLYETGMNSLQLIVLIGCAAALLALLAARILSRCFRFKHYLPGVLGAGLLFICSALGGLAVCRSGSSSLLAVNGVLVMFVLGWFVYEGVRRRDSELPAYPDPVLPSTLQELAEALIRPLYQKPARFDEALNWINGIGSEDVVAVLITGQGGSGKTRSAEELVTMLKNTVQHRRGAFFSCTTNGEKRPLEAFRDALGPSLGLGIFAPTHEQGIQLSTAMGNFVENACAILPLGGLLRPLVHTIAASRPQMEQEWFKLIADALYRYAGARDLTILLIDNMHCLSETSRNFVAFLMRELRSRRPKKGRVPHAEKRIIIIMTCDNRQAETIELLKKSGARAFELEADSDDLPRRILKKSLCLSEKTADQLVAECFSPTHTDFCGNNLGWLLHIMRYLAHERCIELLPDGRFAIVREDAIHIPTDFYDGFQRMIAQLGAEERRVLGCAALIGHEFEADVLATVLGWKRVDLLSMLSRIEEETGFVHDVREEDDVYEFMPKIMVEGFKRLGTALNDRSQIVQEYHRLLVGEYEKRPDKIFECAEHAFLAGRGFRGKAAEHCRKAAFSARERSLYSAAARFAGMALESMEQHDDGDPRAADRLQSTVELACLQIDCMLRVAKERQTPVAVAEKHLERLRDMSGAHALRVRLLRRSALALYYCGNEEQGAERAEEALQEAALLSGDDRSYATARCLHVKALCLLRQGKDRISQAVEILQEAKKTIARLAEKEKGGASRMRQAFGEICDTLGSALLESDDFTEKKKALGEFRKSLETKESIGDLYGTALSCGQLGRYYLGIEHDYGTACSYFQKDLALAEKLGDHRGQTVIHSNLAECYARMSDGVQVRQHYERSLELACIGDDSAGQVFALAGLLQISRAEKQFSAVRRYGQEILNRCRTLQQQALLKGYLRETIQNTLRLTQDEHGGDEWHIRLQELNSRAVTSVTPA